MTIPQASSKMWLFFEQIALIFIELYLKETFITIPPFPNIWNNYNITLLLATDLFNGFGTDYEFYYYSFTFLIRTELDIQIITGMTSVQI